jgi:alpha-L-fucosidase
MTKADGKGLWWEGLDPQDLYAQYHPAGKYSWAQSENPPLAKPFVEKYFNRIIDVIDKYHPDLLYFDDSILPIYPSTDIGLRIAAYLYNTSVARNGKLEAVMTTKGLNADQRRAPGAGSRARRPGRHRGPALADGHLHRELALTSAAFSTSTNTRRPNRSHRCSWTSSAKMEICS